MENNSQHSDGPGKLPGSLTHPLRPGPDSAASLAGFAKRLLLAILLLAAAYLAWAGIHVVLLTFAGILFAVFLSSLSHWLSTHTGLGHRTALISVVLALLALAAGAGWLLANRLGVELKQLSQQLPQSLE
jgi:predicted PurR-regulated permease PerM